MSKINKIESTVYKTVYEAVSSNIRNIAYEDINSTIDSAIYLDVLFDIDSAVDSAVVYIGANIYSDVYFAVDLVYWDVRSAVYKAIRE